MGGVRFFRTANLSFTKEDHKIGLYTKNQQNSMSRLNDIRPNVDFGPKGRKFGPKTAQNGRG